MLKSSLQNILLTVTLLLTSYLIKAQKVQEPTDVDSNWTKPYLPFRIVGNLYYVGTYDLACYLITTNKGNILINTGLASSASQIKNNIEKLGFKFQDTRIFLTTQAHFDHLGALAEIKKLTGAKVMVDWKDAAVMSDGGASDYALGGKGAMFEPVKPDRLLHDRDTISLGGTKLVMLHHPGHTKGSCSFIFDTKDKKRNYRVLIANMPTIITDDSFDKVTLYPSIAKDYANTLHSMKNLQFDIWVASHASQFKLHKKHKPGDAYNPSAFKDRVGYNTSVEQLQKQYDEHLKKQ